MYGLQIKEVPKVGFLGGRLGNDNQVAAFTKINNLFASVSISELEPDSINQILAEHKLEFKSAPQAFKDLYSKIFQYFLSDKHISDAEENEMQRLRYLLSITPPEAAQIEFSVKDYYYSQAVMYVLQDRKVTIEEEKYLEMLAKGLRIPPERALLIYQNYAQQLYQQIIDQAISDRRLSPDEDEYLTNLAKELRANTEFANPQSKAAIERFRALWNLAAGDLPNYQVPILLQKNERCPLYIRNCKRYETQSVYVGSYIVKPIYTQQTWAGQRRIPGPFKLISQSVDYSEYQDMGDLYITNKRLIFNGQMKSVTVANGRILNFTVFGDGLRIEKGSGKDLIFEFNADSDVVQATLEGIFR